MIQVTPQMRIRVAVGHADRCKAERQRAQKERELRMGFVEPNSMRLSEFVKDSIARTKGQVAKGTLSEYDSTMRQFIKIIGDVDFRSIRYQHGEQFIQTSLDGGNRPATVKKKIGTLKQATVPAGRATRSAGGKSPQVCPQTESPPL